MAGDITGRHISKVADLIGGRWQDLGIKLGISHNELQNLATPATGGPSQYASRVSNDIERVFQEISEMLIRDWKGVGLCLNIDSTKLNAASSSQPLDENPRQRMLEMWQERSDQGTRREQLITALRELGREDIVIAIEEVDAKTRRRNRNTQERSGVTQPSQPQPQRTGANTCTLFEQLDLSHADDDDIAVTPSDDSPDMAHAEDGGVSKPPPLLYDATNSSLSGNTTPEDEVTDVNMLHDPPSVSDKTSSRLNPSFEWMGSEFRRLRDAVNMAPVSRPVVIALLDSGVNTSHPELNGLIVRSENFIGKKTAGQFIPNQQDENDLRRDNLNHGTVSAGIIRQYAGDKNVKILNLKVLKSDSSGSLRYVSRALEYIKKWDKDNPTMPVDIVLMTLGHPKDDATTNRYLAELGEEKVLICSAANEGQRRADSILSPAKHGSVIAIGSCNLSGSRCDHSAVGGQLAFLFPGSDIWSTSSKYTPSDQNSRYILRYGTSFAAPHCAALVAVILPFIERKLHDFQEKTGMDWRRKVTNSNKMKELIRDFCHRDHSTSMGYGVPELHRITRNRIADFLENNF